MRSKKQKQYGRERVIKWYFKHNIEYGKTYIQKTD